MTTASTAIAIRDDQVTFDELQKKALVHIGVEKASDADLAVFFHTCKRTGLDPFARQVYLIERWTADGPKQTIQTGIDGFRLIAQRTVERTHGSLGYEDTQWCGTDGVWRDVWLTADPPAAARVTIVRDGQRFPGIALYHEYVQKKKNGDPTKMWVDKAALMLAKCAEAQALRKAFPQDLSGLYTTDELVDDQPGPSRVSAEPESSSAKDRMRSMLGNDQAEAEPPADADVVDAEVVDEAGITKAQLAKIGAAMRDLNITGRDEALLYVADKIGHEIASRSDLTKPEASKVIEALEADLALVNGDVQAAS